jgi:hypothetical protein
LLDGAEVRDQLGLSCLPSYQDVPVAAEAGEGLWGLARTIKAGVNWALKDGHVFDPIKESHGFLIIRRLTQHFIFQRFIKVGRSSTSQFLDE